jgi:hypothetical protein
MYGLTRAMLTLIGVAVAGFLLWLAMQVLPDDRSTTGPGDYWAALGIVAVAGLTMALSQLLGGWTKWGWPRVSGNVFLIAFLPTLVVGAWILAAGEPGGHWLGDHVRNWSGDLGIDGVIGDLTTLGPAVAFGTGLVFGFTFDTTGPRVRERAPVPAAAKEQDAATDQEQAAATDGARDDRRVRIREGGAPDTPESTPEPAPEPAPRAEEPPKS